MGRRTAFTQFCLENDFTKESREGLPQWGINTRSAGWMLWRKHASPGALALRFVLPKLPVMDQHPLRKTLSCVVRACQTRAALKPGACLSSVLNTNLPQRGRSWRGL